MVGEVPLERRRCSRPTTALGDELHMVFDFALMHVPWSRRGVRGGDPRGGAGVRGARISGPAGCSRITTSLATARASAGSEARARAAAVLLLTLRGTPCLYAGEELGLLDADVPQPSASTRRARRLAGADPVGRRRARLAAIPWLPCRPSRAPERRDRDAIRHSILALYRRLLAIRRSSPALSARELASCSTRPPTRSSTSARGRATFAASPSTSPIAGARTSPLPTAGSVEITTGARREGRPGTARSSRPRRSSSADARP